MTPDIVYVVRHGDRNEELRYSLRSLANLPHGRVWLAGYLPSWVQDVGHITAPKMPPGHQQTKANLRAACEAPDVSDEFVYFNDDFFVMQPMDEVPVMHRGTIDEVIKTSGQATAYLRAMERTRDILTERGVPEPLMYDLHAPMLVSKAGMLAALDLCEAPLIHERTLYGNLQAVGGERTHNHKVRRRNSGWEAWPFLSTSDSTFAHDAVGRHIRAAFPEMSPYESSPPAPLPVPPTRVARRPVRYSRSNPRPRAAA